MFVHYLTGLTAFDFISDFEEWIECGYFNEEIKARLKGNPSIHERLSLEELVAHVSSFFIISMSHYRVVYVGTANGERQGRVRRISVSFLGAECFLSCARHLCKFIGTEERVFTAKEFTSHETGLERQHGLCFVSLKHLKYLYGRP